MIICLAHLREIHRLPALPDACNKGAISGLKVRGSFEVDIKWNNHQLTSAVISSGAGRICIIRTATPVRINGVNAQSIAASN